MRNAFASNKVSGKSFVAGGRWGDQGGAAEKDRKAHAAGGTALLLVLRLRHFLFAAVVVAFRHHRVTTIGLVRRRSLRRQGHDRTRQREHEREMNEEAKAHCDAHSVACTGAADKTSIPLREDPSCRRALSCASARRYRADGQCIPLQEGAIVPTGSAFLLSEVPSRRKTVHSSSGWRDFSHAPYLAGREGSVVAPIPPFLFGQAPSLPRSLPSSSGKLRCRPDPSLPFPASSVVAPIPLFRLRQASSLPRYLSSASEGPRQLRTLRPRFIRHGFLQSRRRGSAPRGAYGVSGEHTGSVCECCGFMLRLRATTPSHPLLSERPVAGRG